MLDSTVKFLADEVNQYLLRRTASALFQVEPGSLVDDSGKWAVKEGAIGLALANVEEERTLREQVPERLIRNGAQVTLPPVLKLNLQVIFAARHKDYVHALRYLSYVMTFFQSHSVFTPDEYPGLDKGIEKLSLEMIAYGPEQLNQLWAYIGAKYLPSVVYRVRMVVLQDVEPQEIGRPITTIATVVHGK